MQREAPWANTGGRQTVAARFAEAGATTAVQASEDVVPASQLREAYAKIRELERAPSLRRESAR